MSLLTFTKKFSHKTVSRLARQSSGSIIFIGCSVLDSVVVDYLNLKECRFNQFVINSISILPK